MDAAGFVAHQQRRRLGHEAHRREARPHLAGRIRTTKRCHSFFFKKKNPQNPSSLNRLPFTLPFSGDVRFGQHQDQTKGWPKPMSADLAVARKGRERPTNCGAGTMRHISTICCRSTAIRPSASGWHANATTKPCRSRWLIIIKCFSIGFARPMELSGCVRRIVSIELFEEMETVYLFVCFFAFLMLYDE